MRDQKLSALIVPVGGSPENGRALFHAPVDLISRIIRMEREYELKGKVQSVAEKQPGADDSPDPDSPVYPLGRGKGSERG